MKNFALVAALMASVAAAPAFAGSDQNNGKGQNQAGAQTKMKTGIQGNGDVNTNANAKVKTGMQGNGDANAEAKANGNSSANANFGSAISAIQAGKDVAARIEGATDLRSVQVVRVDDLTQGQNKAALDNALTKNSAQVGQLRTAIGANAKLKSELEAQSIDPSTVVGADVTSDNQVTVYVR